MKRRPNSIQIIIEAFPPRNGLKPYSCCARCTLDARGHSVKTEKDYEEFLELFNKHEVRYCLIGAFALAFHAQPRYTKDIDVLVEASEENAEKILTALNEFGFGTLDLNPADFSAPGGIIQLGYEPVRIDIIKASPDLDFPKIWRNRVQGPYGELRVNYIARQDLVRLKKKSNRPQDKADLATLLAG